jgi:hypothetical protein
MRIDIYVKGIIKLSIGNVKQAILLQLNAYMVAKDIKLSKRLNRLFDDFDTLLLFTQVSREKQAVLAKLFYPRFCLVRIVMFIQIRDGHVSAFLRKSNRRSGAYSAVPTGNKGDLFF